MNKEYLIDFSDMSGGINSTSPPHALNNNQVSKSVNLIHEDVGVSRAPGYYGISQLSKVTGFMRYVLDDGTEVVIIATIGKIYRINTSDGSLTELYDSIETSSTWQSVNVCGKLWICNGKEFLFINEKLKVFPVGLDAPVKGVYTAATMLSTGGSLEIGVYHVYYCYVSTDDSGRRLYSYPYYYGGTSANTDHSSLSIYYTNSDSERVDKIAFFMTDKDGSLPYLYKVIDNITGGGESNLIIKNDSNRDELITLYAVAGSNQKLSEIPDNIYAFDNRLFVWNNKSKLIRFSLQSDINSSDLERFPAANFRVMSKAVYSMFSIGENLYFNSVGNGISVAYYGDMSSTVKHINKQLWFLDCNTAEGKKNIVDVNGIVFGLTNDGFRFFDGSTFSDDISSTIKPEVDNIYPVINNNVSMCIYRRKGKRTEIRFSYKNIDYGLGGNNAQLVFNVDKFFNVDSSKKSWEMWENGFEYMLVCNNGWYGCQSGNSSYVVKENGVVDIYCYNKNRIYCSEKHTKKAYIMSRTVIHELDTISIWGSIYGLATSKGNISGNVIIFDNDYTKYEFGLGGVSGTTVALPSEASGLSLAIPFVMKPSNPKTSTVPMPFDCRGNCVAIEIYQDDDDEDFFIYKLQLPRVHKEKNILT